MVIAEDDGVSGESGAIGDSGAGGEVVQVWVYTSMVSTCM